MPQVLAPRRACRRAAPTWSARPSARTVSSRPTRSASAAPASPSTSIDSRPVRPSDSAFSPGDELQRQHAHADEVRPVDPLEALGEHGAHAEQSRALRRPVTRRAGAVLLAGDDDERHAFGLVADGGVEDGRLLAIGQVQRHAALGLRNEVVADAGVGEGPADHDLVVAASRPVGVELGDRHAVGSAARGRPGWRAGSIRRARCGRS